MPTPRTPSARTHRRGPLAVLVTGLLALTVLLLTAGTANAHDVITGSDPADGSTVPTAPTQVSVTFDETPQPEGAALTVVGPDGAHHEQGAVTVRDKVVSVPVGALPQAGQYEIGYRVVSSDGHPVSGSVTFDLTTPSAPAGAATTGAPAQAAPADHSGSLRRLRSALARGLRGPRHRERRGARVGLRRDRGRRGRRRRGARAAPPGLTHRAWQHGGTRGTPLGCPSSRRVRPHRSGSGAPGRAHSTIWTRSFGFRCSKNCFASSMPRRTHPAD